MVVREEDEDIVVDEEDWSEPNVVLKCNYDCVKICYYLGVYNKYDVCQFRVNLS